jgi:hypothetical protein
MSPEKLFAALDMIAQGIVQPTKIAKGIMVPYPTYRSWMVQSNRGDPKFLITVDGEEMQWAAAIQLHTKISMFELRGMVTQYSIFGEDVISYKDGQVVWALDPVACAMSEDEREDFGFRRDGLLEIDGRLQPVMRHERAPIQLQLRLLEATFRDMRPASVQEVTMNGNLSVGVGYASGPKGPPMIPPEPPIPQLEIMPDPALVEDDFLDILGPELEPDIDEVEVEPTQGPYDRTVIDEAAPAPVQPAAPATRPLPPLVIEPVIRGEPTEAQTPPPQEGILAQPKQGVPQAWKSQWAALQLKLDRGPQ